MSWQCFNSIFLPRCHRSVLQQLVVINCHSSNGTNREINRHISIQKETQDPKNFILHHGRAGLCKRFHDTWFVWLTVILEFGLCSLSLTFPQLVPSVIPKIEGNYVVFTVFYVRTVFSRCAFYKVVVSLQIWVSNYRSNSASYPNYKLPEKATQGTSNPLF